MVEVTLEDTPWTRKRCCPAATRSERHRRPAAGRAAGWRQADADAGDRGRGRGVPCRPCRALGPAGSSSPGAQRACPRAADPDRHRPTRGAPAQGPRPRCCRERRVDPVQLGDPAGLLLLDGMDRATLGPGSRRLAAGAPQFHENHILTGPLAFNLLMGRDWPASVEELARARALCVELGLGGLLDRMPAGLMQQVGETGWQLSHGERSRVFLARALLQDARLTVLDESFAALDPVTLKACLGSAVARARTLVVVAH